MKCNFLTDWADYSGSEGVRLASDSSLVALLCPFVIGWSYCTARPDLEQHEGNTMRPIHIL